MEAEVKKHFSFQLIIKHDQFMLTEFLMPFYCPCSHKSSSIQKETPKKKPKLEMKPSNGDRYSKSCYLADKNEMPKLSVFNLFSLTYQ